MTIQANKAVSIQYILKDDDGTILDQSVPEMPLVYLHGHGNIIVGLEQALDGKNVGETVNVTVAPKDGYGEYDEGLVQTVPRELFEGVDTIEAGMQFQAQTAEGMQIVTVTGVTDTEISVDANHDLAGKTLHFEAKITDIRDATDDELQHGHIHTGG